MDKIIFIGAFIILFGFIVFLNFFSKKATIIRKLKKSANQKIANVTDGEIARITGKVELIAEPLTAPLSGRSCVFYHVLVEQRVSTGKSVRWKTLIEEEVAGEFGIRDDDYCARIEGGNMKSYIVDDRKFTSGYMNDASEDLLQYLRRHGYDSENFLGLNKTIRYREGILEEGETIAVLGKCRWQSAESGQWSDTYGKVLVIGPAGKEPVYLSDGPMTTKQ